MIRSTTPVSVAEGDFAVSEDTIDREVTGIFPGTQIDRCRPGSTPRSEVEASVRPNGRPLLRQSRGNRQARAVENVGPREFLPLIQLAVTPVILLTGVGALMLTLTNRLGRVVDRIRALAGQMRLVVPVEQAHLEGQLAILWRRAKLVRLAVTFAGLSMFFACVLVLAIFVDAALERDFGLELVVLFIASVLSLISALVAFLRDIWLSLHALALEVARARASGLERAAG